MSISEIIIGTFAGMVIAYYSHDSWCEIAKTKSWKKKKVYKNPVHCEWCGETFEKEGITEHYKRHLADERVGLDGERNSR